MHDDPGNARFRFDSRLAGSALELALAGDFDMAATFRLESELDRLLAGGGVRRLVLDLGEVRFMDSSGLGALLSIRERTQALDIEMSLRDVSDPVRRLLLLTGTSGLVAD